MFIFRVGVAGPVIKLVVEKAKLSPVVSRALLLVSHTSKLFTCESNIMSRAKKHSGCESRITLDVSCQ